MSDGRPIREALGVALRERRQAAGLSLADVAARADLSATHLSEVERGVKDISTDRLARACRALRTAPSTIFADIGATLAAGETPAIAARSTGLVRATERLSPAARQTVAEFTAYLASKEASGRRRRIGFEF